MMNDNQIMLLLHLALLFLGITIIMLLVEIADSLMEQRYMFYKMMKENDDGS